MVDFHFKNIMYHNFLHFCWRMIFCSYSFPFFVRMPAFLFVFERRRVIISSVFWPQSCQCSSPLCFPTCMLTMSPLFGVEQPLVLTQFTSQRLIMPRFDWSNLNQSHCGACVPWQQGLCVLKLKRHMCLE